MHHRTSGLGLDSNHADTADDQCPPAPASSRASSTSGSSSANSQIVEEDAAASKRPKLAMLKISPGAEYRLLLPVALVALCCAMATLGPIRRAVPNTEAPTTAAAANEMFDDANETPAGNDGFNDDDDDDEGAMDASASGDYPEADGGADDPDDDPDGGESRQTGSWMVPGAQAARLVERLPIRRYRMKRDMDDVASELQRRLAVEAKRKSIRLNSRPEDLEFIMDDGDVDAWVHDGVDDIHIDPETKQAASQLSHDERSIDAEYEPHQASEQDVMVNKTRVTTIAEVIPMRSDRFSGAGDDDEPPGNRETTRISERYATPPLLGASLYLPAAYLSMDQAVRLMDAAATTRSYAPHERLKRSYLPDATWPLGRQLARNTFLQSTHRGRP